jgi:acyl carrier protein
MTATTLEDRVKTCIAEQVILPLADIKDDDTLVVLSFDSLDRVELVMALEDEFGVEIVDEVAIGWTTVQSVIETVRTEVES